MSVDEGTIKVWIIFVTSYYITNRLDYHIAVDY